MAIQKRAVRKVVDALISGSPAEHIRAASSRCSSVPIQKIADTVLQCRQKIRSLDFPVGRRLSVIVPHYNHIEYLKDALESLSMQTVQPYEVIVVDDASDDVPRLISLIESFSTHLSIRLILNKNKIYTGKCRQVGADLATGDVLVMHDADDISHPQRLELTQKMFLRYPKACQLNVGFYRFTEYMRTPASKFGSDDLSSAIVGLEEIDISMRPVLIDQRLSIRNRYGTRFGGYGTPSPKSVSSGHVAYLRCLSPFITWTSPHDFIFTSYEDFDFNLILYLSARSAFEITLPLIGYRQGSTTNRSSS